MSGLRGFDAWLTYDEQGERAAALESHIDSDDRLSQMQRSCERADERVQRLEKHLEATPPGGYRVRVMCVLRWAKARSRYYESNLRDALEDEGEQPEPIGDDE